MNRAASTLNFREDWNWTMRKRPYVFTTEMSSSVSDQQGTILRDACLLWLIAAAAVRVHPLWPATCKAERLSYRVDTVVCFAGCHHLHTQTL
jgi:hypothetical protein